MKAAWERIELCIYNSRHNSVFWLMFIKMKCIADCMSSLKILPIIITCKYSNSIHEYFLYFYIQYTSKYMYCNIQLFRCQSENQDIHSRNKKSVKSISFFFKNLINLLINATCHFFQLMHILTIKKYSPKFSDALFMNWDFISFLTMQWLIFYINYHALVP